MTTTTLQHKIRTASHAVDSAATPKITRIALIVVAVFFIAYIALVARTVFAGVERHSLIGETRDVSANVATLEVEYLALSRTLSREHASALGLTETKNVSYANVSDTLTLNTNEQSY